MRSLVIIRLSLGGRIGGVTKLGLSISHVSLVLGDSVSSGLSSLAGCVSGSLRLRLGRRSLVELCLGVILSILSSTGGNAILIQLALRVLNRPLGRGQGVISPLKVSRSGCLNTGTSHGIGSGVNSRLRVVNRGLRRTLGRRGTGNRTRISINGLLSLVGCALGRRLGRSSGVNGLVNILGLTLRRRRNSIGVNRGNQLCRPSRAGKSSGRDQGKHLFSIQFQKSAFSI